MSPTPPIPPVDRRGFLKSLAGVGGAVLLTTYAGDAFAAIAPAAVAPHTGLAPLKDRIGLQLFTVRDRFMKDFPGTLRDVAAAGYKEVQTTLSYGDYSLDQIKSFLDAAGLVAPATHVSPPNGPDFERTLDAYARIGHRYTTVNTGPARRRGAPGAGRPAGARPNAAGQRPAPPAQTLDSVKRTAAALNDAGRVTQKHGLKVIVHNHTVEFAPLADSSQRPYDVLIAETDPALVALELDIGWATVAGENALDLFERAPGRFEVWHVKDVVGLASLAGKSEAERQRAAKIVPIGEGEIDYRAIFAQAELAGMKHFFVEQDSAPDSGDSIAAAATSYRNLARILS
ncbi:MAG TPA: sugar phosphate isomerase/epimerase [Gemmatimonadaceae bacterium]|nr:sugar phosphate isomerase/epimerase [Gemmatimonadaceae bacterium]